MRAVLLYKMHLSEKSGGIMLYAVRICFDIFFDFVNENEQHRGFITLVTQSMHRKYVKYVCTLLFILIVNNYYSYFFTSPPST